MIRDVQAPGSARERTSVVSYCVRAGLVLLILVVFLTPLLEIIPMAALVAVMIMVSIDTFSWASIRDLPKHPMSTNIVMISTVAVTVITHNLAIGVLTGVLLAALFFANKVSRFMYVRSDVQSLPDDQTLHRRYEEEMRLLVLGKQGEDGDAVERHIGSHLESTIRRVQKPILVAPLAFREPERFLIAYDGSPAARKVVVRITESPLLQGLEAHLLLVDADTAVNRERLLAPLQQLDAAGFTVHAEVRSGGIDETVCNYRKEQDIHLMAMGAYGHSRLRRFFVGSTTTHMIMRSSTPLLILR